MRPKFIFCDGKFWLRNGWMFYSSYSLIVFSFVSSKSSSCSTSESSMLWYYVSIWWVSSWVLSIELIWSYGSSKRTGFNFGWWRAIVAWVGSVLYVSVFLLNSLGRDPFSLLLWRSCSLDYFFFMNNGPLKRQVYIFPSCSINNYLTPLLLIPHPMQYSFRYGTDEVLCL